MPRFAQSVLLTTTVLLTAHHLHGQESTLGLNLRISGAPQVGVTWLRSSGFAIRPSLTASWRKIESPSPFGPDVETSQVGVDLDFLLRAATWDRVTSYYGLGGSVVRFSSDGSDTDIWRARALLGARVTLFQRVAIFGEVGVEYQDADAPFGQRVDLATFPLGIVVFLK